MRKAVCPGSFDPVTNGHLDIVSRAARLFDEVTIALGYNESKQGLFTVDERIEMLEDTVRDYDYVNVNVEAFQGLLVDFCRDRGIIAIVKGLRAVSDFDYELQMAQMNRSLIEVDTLLVPTSPQYSFLASSLVREVAKHGGDVSGFVPAPVLRALHARLDENKLAADGEGRR